MALPQTVEKQEKLADELIDGQAPPEDEGFVAPLGADEADVSREASTPIPPQEQPEKQRIDPEDWKERYSSLRSHRDEELAMARRERDEMAVQVDAQARERNALVARMADMDEAAQRARGLPANVLSAEELELVGEDAIPALTKMARAVASQETARLNRQVNSLTQAFGQRDQETHQSRVHAYNNGFKHRLVTAMPEAEQIDADPEFHAWLDGRDNLSGLPRRELAGRAWQNQDVGRVANLYSEWQAETGGQQRNPRDGRLMPGRVADRAQQQTSQRQWNSGSIARFYEDVRRGKYKESEADALERDLFKAQAEGRLRS